MDGLRDGQGKLYDPQTQLPVYEGTFRIGFYDGTGKLYKTTWVNWSMRENFFWGEKNGNGITYDGATGLILEEGIYREWCSGRLSKMQV